MTFMARQGDVLIIGVKSIPANVEAVERERGSVILAHGEVTGHAHAILDDRSQLTRDPKLNMMFLKADGDLKGPIAGKLIEINHKKGWFLAQTDLRARPIKFALSHAQIEDGVIECGPFTLLDHEEHYPGAIPNGDNQVIRQREYVAPEVVRNVAD